MTRASPQNRYRASGTGPLPALIVDTCYADPDLISISTAIHPKYGSDGKLVSDLVIQANRTVAIGASPIGMVASWRVAKGT